MPDMRRLLLAGVLLIGATAACGERKALRLAATTTIENSGLLPELLEAFRQDTGVTVEAVIGGSGRALDVLERGDVDVAFTHDPEAEQVRIDRGVITTYRKVMYNAFIIAGPKADPSGVRRTSNAVDAMARIAGGRAPFVSRADSSGTHSREQLLWKLAGKAPDASRLIEAGQGMSATLRVASEREAYVLTDRATFRQIEPTLRLVMLFEGDPLLLNTYAVMLGQTLKESQAESARRLFNFLTAGRGRDVITGYQIKGQPAFTIWPLSAPRDHPAALPHVQ